MVDIELDEIPKSKEFMKHAKVAKGLTKETGLEHGFRFCKQNDKIIADKMCVGKQCEIIITEEKCTPNDNYFHTHPYKYESEQSIYDIYMSSKYSNENKKPNISCVSGSKTDYIKCDMIPTNTFNYMSSKMDEHEKEKEEGSMTFGISDILWSIKGTFIEFNDETGKIETKGTYKDAADNIMKRFKEGQKKWLEE